MSSDFVFTLRIKVPKPSSSLPGRVMVVINSNVRIPNFVLNELQWIIPAMYTERLRQNHVVIFHLWPQEWQCFGEGILSALVRAPSNSRRQFPAQVLTVERFTGRVIDWVQYPILPR